MKHRILKITYYFPDKRSPIKEFVDIPVPSVRKFKRQLKISHPEVSGIEFAYETKIE